MKPPRALMLLFTAACCLSCRGSTSPDPEASEINRLLIFVRDWPSEYVEIDLRREAGQSTFLIYRPQQTGVPRVLLDSIGPQAEDPEEVIALMKAFDVWALADSNAVGAACSTKPGHWVCYPTIEDYSLVMSVSRGGTTRAQRYTRLNESSGHKTARALGDLIFAMARKRTETRSRSTRE